MGHNNFVFLRASTAACSREAIEGRSKLVHDAQTTVAITSFQRPRKNTRRVDGVYANV